MVNRFVLPAMLILLALPSCKRVRDFYEIKEIKVLALADKPNVFRLNIEKDFVSSGDSPWSILDGREPGRRGSKNVIKRFEIYLLQDGKKLMLNNSVFFWQTQ